MIITPLHESNDCHKPPGRGGGQFCAGDVVRFEGDAADKSVIGSMDVTVVDPHSNRAKITHVTTGKRPRAYEGATSHIPTARVRNQRGREFEAYHHTLRKKS